MMSPEFPAGEMNQRKNQTAFGRSLQRKAWGITVGVFVVLGGLVILTIHLMQSHSVAGIERDLVRQSAERLQMAVNAAADELAQVTQDYATWDDTWNYAAQPNETYVANNLNESTFNNLNLNTLAVFDTRGRLLRGFVLRDKKEGRQALDSPVWESLVSRPSWVGDGRRGVFRLGDTLVLFSVMPILHSDRSGPRNGYILFARLMDQNFQEKLKTITGLNLVLHDTTPVLGNELEEELLKSDDSIPYGAHGDQELHFHYPLKDVLGNKVATVHVVLERSLYKEARNTSILILATTILMGGIACFLILRLLRVLVTGPLEKLNAQVQNIGAKPEAHQRVTVQGNDEIADLARQINSTLDVLDKTMAQQAQAKRESEILQSRLLEAQKMEAIGTMAGGLAHDFNNMLNSILGSADLLRFELAQNHSGQEHIRRIEKAGANASALVRQLLAVGRKQSLKLEPLHLKALIQDVLRLLRAGLPKNIEFQFESLSDEDLVMADSAQLHQVIMNLATNSAHAMAGRERGLFKITLNKVELSPLLSKGQGIKPGTYLHLAISDNGSGIPEAFLARIFEPFFTTKPAGSGSGLGLAVVHGIITKHNGSIRVESQKDLGTCFHIHLPLSRDQHPSPSESRHTPSEQKFGNVLLVDDDRLVRDTLSAGLERWGYRVLCTGNTEEALSILGSPEARIDFLVTDQVMPGTSGIELGLKARKMQPKLRLLLISGFSDALDSGSALDKGFSQVISKPVTASQLHAALQEAWGA